MKLLIHIDLSSADLAKFEAYERDVLALLPNYGGVLELRVRGVDRLVETHVLAFPSQAHFDAFVADRRRVAMAQDWADCGAKAERWLVADVANPPQS